MAIEDLQLNIACVDLTAITEFVPLRAHLLMNLLRQCSAGPSVIWLANSSAAVADHHEAIVLIGDPLTRIIAPVIVFEAWVVA